MNELARAARMLGNLPTAIQRINYPVHKGQPNPAHGKYYFIGRVPVECIDPLTGRSRHYDTEEQAVAAARAAGVLRVQLSDLSWAE